MTRSWIAWTRRRQEREGCCSGRLFGLGDDASRLSIRRQMDARLDVTANRWKSFPRMLIGWSQTTVQRGSTRVALMLRTTDRTGQKFKLLPVFSDLMEERHFRMDDIRVYFQSLRTCLVILRNIIHVLKLM